MKWLKRWKTQTLLQAAIGPGFSIANADTDAIGILNHSFVHAQCPGGTLSEILHRVTGQSISHGFRTSFLPAVGEP
jgi:hypothetical protein